MIVWPDSIPDTAVCANSTLGSSTCAFHYDPRRVWTTDQLEVLDVLVHPLWIFDFVERRMRWANTAALDMWNSELREEFLNRSFQDLSASSVKRLGEILIKCEKGQDVSDDWTLYPKGKALSVHLNARGIRMSEGEDHTCILFEGIPCRKEELEHSKTRGVEMLRHLPLAVCQFDMQGQMMYQNPEAMLAEAGVEFAMSSGEDGRTTGKPIGNRQDDTDSLSGTAASSTTTCTSASSDGTFPQTMDEGSRKADPGGLLSRFVDPMLGRRVLNQMRSEDSCDLETVIWTRNGPRSCVVQLRKSKDPVTSEDVILFSARDNSDALQVRKERLAREQKSEFFAIMAHEIRTPLHQVAGYIDLLNQTPLSEEQQSYVSILKTATKGLMTVISDVLDFSKLEEGKLKVECIPYEPLIVVKGSIEAVRPGCEERNLYLRLEWDKEIPLRIQGDPNRLRQIMLNLLSNAAKFTSNGGICVQALHIMQAQPMVKFIVTDTGIGLAAEHQSIIFQKYQQANVAIARQYGGTGLGLSICQLLVERMGGGSTIGVDSELGKGSSFWFTVPAIRPPDKGEVSCHCNDSFAALSTADDATSLHVLVAEDNKVNQKLVARMLERMGHTCDIADNGLMALEMITKRHYDCCLMDIQMPTMDGLEATKRIRSIGYIDLPIMGLTASVTPAAFDKLGFNDWITKPVPMNLLKSKLGEISHSLAR